jgi:hypothetical protein
VHDRRLGFGRKSWCKEPCAAAARIAAGACLSLVDPPGTVVHSMPCRVPSLRRLPPLHLVAVACSKRSSLRQSSRCKSDRTVHCSAHRSRRLARLFLPKWTKQFSRMIT